MGKILHLIFNLDIGGSENMLIDIANEQALYTDVTIVLINNRFNPELVRRIAPAVHFYPLRREEGNKRSIKFLLKLWIILLRKNPDVIHCHNHEIIRLLPLYKRRVVLTVHCLKIPSLYFSKYQKVYSVSHAVATEVKNRSGIISPVVVNGINFREIIPKTAENIRRSSQGGDLAIDCVSFGPLHLARGKMRSLTEGQTAETLSSDCFPGKKPAIRLVQIARLKHEMKGQDLLLIALKQVLESSPNCGVTIDFIGSGKSEAHLRKLSTDLGLDGCVTFLGNKSRTWIYDNLHTYDILVHPSRYEAFGLAMIEGIAAGLPVIASNEPGLAEILSDKPTGHFFNSGDALDLAQVIKTLTLKLIQSDMQNLCETSRSIAEEQYSVRRTAREYMAHYSADLGITVNWAI